MSKDDKLENMLAVANRDARHQRAINASDWEHLKGCLGSAAERMADVADIIEKDRNYDPVSFLRASAARLKRELELL